MDARIIAIHGLATTGVDYADKLRDHLEPDAPRMYVLQWAGVGGLLDFVSSWRSAFRRPPAPRWRLLRRLHIRWIDAAHEAAVWVCAYDRPEIHGAVLQYVQTSIARRADADGRLYFVAHSLGTIVLVEALSAMLDDGRLAPGQVGGIVTMGSPLNFWRDPETLHNLVRPIAGVAPWRNVYDVDDEIAGLLGPVNAAIQDVEIHTGGLLTSHVSYWGSREVAGIVREMLGEK